MIGLKRNKTIIRNPLSSRAKSIASKMGYCCVNRVTNPSRNRYRLNKNEAIAPKLAPTKTATLANNTPYPKLSRAVVNTKPAPRVKIAPGTKKIVHTKYTPIKAITPNPDNETKAQ